MMVKVLKNKWKTFFHIHALIIEYHQKIKEKKYIVHSFTPANLKSKKKYS